jgi:hypothetical protein
MDKATPDFHPPDSGFAPEDGAENPKGSLLAFPPHCQTPDRRLLRSFMRSKQVNQKPERKTTRLISKHAQCYGHFIVGSRVAAISDGKIVQGTILGTKAKPWRPAAFWRKAFAGCWILLDSGERVVAYELRPIHVIQRRT